MDPRVIASKKNRHIVDNLGEGNCGPCAIADQLYVHKGVKYDPDTIRKFVVKNMKENPKSVGSCQLKGQGYSIFSTCNSVCVLQRGDSLH